MGEVVPDGFVMSSLANDAERRVVEAFRDGLSDSWLILPSVHIRTDQRDYELDVVLINKTYGVIDIEVKGHRVEIRSGRWMHAGQPTQPQPMDQAQKNAYALREVIRREVPSLARLEVEYGVALPNTTNLSGNLPPGAARVQVLTGASLEDVSDAIEFLALARHNAVVLTDQDVEAMVTALCPDADFAFDPNARMRTARRRLEDLSAAQTQALERLDVNRKVVALGAAGTGKTRLAMAWARRAFGRGERVLLTCYNDPLADRTAEQLPDDECLRMGSFFKLARGLRGMPPLEVPDDADHEWWNHTAVGHLHANWHLVDESFDTIVVDEAQDFSPAWLAQLESLLDPDGPRRILLLADPAQELYGRGFTVPRADDGWTHCELVSNCRNAHEIGSLLRRKFDGAPAPARGPSAAGMSFVDVEDGSVATAVQGEIDRLVMGEERDAGQIAVLTFSSRVRDELRPGCGLVRWEDRADGIICETVHRAKGLEADTVILVSDAPEVPDHLLYIGISRAVSELVVVGPAGLGSRLGLSSNVAGARP